MPHGTYIHNMITRILNYAIEVHIWNQTRKNNIFVCRAWILLHFLLALEQTYVQKYWTVLSNDIFYGPNGKMCYRNVVAKAFW